MSFVSPPTDCFQISLSLDKNLMRYMQSETTQLFIMNNMLNQCLGTLSFQMLQQNSIDGNSQSSTLRIPQSESDACMPSNISINTVENRENMNNSRKRPRKSLPTSYVPSKLPSISEFHSHKSDVLADSVSNDSLLHSGVKEEVIEENYPPEAEEDGSDDIVCVKEEILDCRNVEKSDQSPYETLELPGLFTKVLPRKYDGDSTPRTKSNRTLEKQPMQTNNNHELDLRPIGGFDSSLRSEYTLGDAVPTASAFSPFSLKSSSSTAASLPSNANGVPPPPIELELPAPQVSPHMSQYYSCPLCGQQFSSRGSANRHIVSVHSNVRYACQICKKVFNRKDALKQHLQGLHQLSTEAASAMMQLPSTAQKLTTST